MDENWMCSYIVKLFVAPERTSQGVGGRLIEEFERDALDAGRDLIVVLPDESTDLTRYADSTSSAGTP
jgi:predicted N-acetyltransferase YhbS